MRAAEMDPHVSYLAFEGETPRRIMRDARGQVFSFEWVDLGYKVDGKTVSAMIPVLLSANGQLGKHYRIERKWKNRDVFDYPDATGRAALTMPRAAERIVKYQMAAGNPL
ncbi:hypothetical protein [Exiguobacterium sp. s163]|uniref:hypothetical protein n=1 Tax=Exiguobacterium sp. s163 TaxID=2751287 RepID=UPI001BEC029E|nr:hypothetical protein [Exiguobacterium sp. s163]